MRVISLSIECAISATGSAIESFDAVAAAIRKLLPDPPECHIHQSWVHSGEELSFVRCSHLGERYAAQYVGKFIQGEPVFTVVIGTSDAGDLRQWNLATEEKANFWFEELADSLNDTEFPGLLEYGKERPRR